MTERVVGLLATVLVGWFLLWVLVCVASGFGDMVGWWDYADRCTPQDAIAFCWTADR